MPLTLSTVVPAALDAGVTPYEIEMRAAGLRDLSALREIKEKPDGWLAIAGRAQLLNAAALFTADTWRRKATRKRG